MLRRVIMSWCHLVAIFVHAATAAAATATITFAGRANDDSLATARNNTAALNAALDALARHPGGTLIVLNQTYWLAGGVQSFGLTNATIQLDGTFRFLAGRKNWPVEKCRNSKTKTCVQKAIDIADARGLTLTSSNGGTVDGNGAPWWGYLNYLLHREDRPRLLTIRNATDVLVERWHFRQSPYHTFHADDVARVEIRHCTVSNRVNDFDGHDPANLAAFNTDGFDLQGRDIYVHNCSVWNQDDCFTIVPISTNGINAKCTENILIEDVEASGLGLTIGVIGPSPAHSCIRNITFRRANMRHTYKGIYIKAGNTLHVDPKASAEITNIMYENITMTEPEQSPIWIGPAQEADSEKACSLVWPKLAPLGAKCPAPLPTVTWTNVTLRNVRVTGSKVSPGVIYGNPDNPMRGVVFDGVVFDPVDPKKWPWRDRFYYCQGVERGVVTGGTSPAPECFLNRTHNAIESGVGMYI